MQSSLFWEPGDSFPGWPDGVGEDVVAVGTPAEATRYGYAVGLPYAGGRAEVFISDVYDNFVNPMVAGNAGRVAASRPGMHGLAALAQVVLPAHGFMVVAWG